MDEFCYKCKSDVPIYENGNVVGSHKCGNKFSSTFETDTCPKCGGKDIKLIPKAFLVLWDTNEDVRAYVTEDMEIRGGLSCEQREVAEKIIYKYGGQYAEQPEYSI